MTSSNGHIFRVTCLLCGEFTGPGDFPTQRPVTQSFDVFFDLRLNKRLSKQPWSWWFETPSLSLWRHCNGCTQNRLSCHQLTHWGRNRMIFILQTTYSNAQYWMSIFGFWFKFHWNLLLVFQITIESKLVQAMAPIQASTWTNFDQDLRRNMVSKCHNDYMNRGKRHIIQLFERCDHSVLFTALVQFSVLWPLIIAPYLRWFFMFSILFVETDVNGSRETYAAMSDNKIIA